MKTRTILYLLFGLLVAASPVFATPALTISGQNGTIIEGQTFSSTDDVCILVTNSTNITIRNNKFIHCYGEGITATSTTGLTVEYNYMDDIRTGVYAVTPISGVNVQYNVFKNPHILGAAARGQCVQFNQVTGTGNRVNYNSCVQTPGRTRNNTNDGINMFSSSGTADDPIQIIGNYIEGWQNSPSAGGIVVGDSGGSYQVIKENIVKNASNALIGVTGGSHISVTNNAVYGLQTTISNIAINAYAGTAACDDITVRDNTVWNIHQTGIVATFYLPTSGGPECTNRNYDTTNGHAHLWLTTNPLPFKDRVAAPPGPTYARDVVYWREYTGLSGNPTTTHYHVYTCSPPPDCTIDGTGTIQAEVTLTPGEVMSWTLPANTRGRVRIYGANSAHTHLLDERSNYLNFDTITPLPARKRAVARTAR